MLFSPLLAITPLHLAYPTKTLALLNGGAISLPDAVTSETSALHWDERANAGVPLTPEEFQLLSVEL